MKLLLIQMGKVRSSGEGVQRKKSKDGVLGMEIFRSKGDEEETTKKSVKISLVKYKKLREMKNDKEVYFKRSNPK